MKNKNAYVYIMASKKNGTLYTGVTSNLEKRVWEHKNNIVKSFTQKYHVHDLVYFEFGENILSAIEREKQIKSGSRKKKIELIEKYNPEWNDLSKNFF